MSDAHDDHKESLTDIIDKIDFDGLRKLERTIMDKFKAAYKIDGVKSMLEKEYKDVDKPISQDELNGVHDGLAHFFAHLKGYDLAEDNKEYAMDQARAEVESVINQAFKRIADNYGLRGRSAGMEYVVGQIRLGKGETVLEQLREAVGDAVRQGYRQRHLSEKGYDLSLPGKRLELAKLYAVEEGEEESRAIDYEGQIQELIYAKAFDKVYKHKPAHDGHGDHH
jgi:hypothetical protein